MNRENAIRISVSAVIVGVLAILWGRADNLAYNAAQQRHILLGRYTVDHTTALLIATPILLAVLWSVWSKSGPKNAAQKREGAFKIICLSVSIVLGAVFMDVALRIAQGGYYQKQGQSYHRRPNKIYEGVSRDRPEAAFSYPKDAKGYPDVKFVLTVDKNGFRNQQAYEDCDWLILGDSFAEGSGVSDEQAWPRLLAKIKGVRVYNLGMSGGSPVTYIDTLKKFGLRLRPKAVVYMLYEGNDLRDGNFSRGRLDNPTKETLFDIVYRRSPLRQVIRDSMIRLLGPVGARRFYGDSRINEPSHPMYPVAWLPIETPDGVGRYYTFDLKRLLQHFVSQEEFRQSTACTETMRLLGRTRRLCDENNIRLILVYAPDKPHILIEEILSRVPAEQLYAFLALREKNLPAAELLGERLRACVEVREGVFEKFCRENKIEFISLTGVLRQATIGGVQTYYTYDQHWTPEGHQVVAKYLAEKIKD